MVFLLTNFQNFQKFGVSGPGNFFKKFLKISFQNSWSFYQNRKNNHLRTQIIISPKSPYWSKFDHIFSKNSNKCLFSHKNFVFSKFMNMLVVGILQLCEKCTSYAEQLYQECIFFTKLKKYATRIVIKHSIRTYIFHIIEKG